MSSTKEPIYVQVLNPDNTNQGQKSWWASWRFGVLLCTVATFVTLLVNVALTAWAANKQNMHNGIGTLYHGNCEETRKISSRIHLAVNAFGTVLLCSSNYCMQRLVAPTRKDIDKAHAERQSLDVGIASLRNLRWVGWKRVTLWVCLGLSSVPLHLLYNSAVFSELAVFSHIVFGVQQDFLVGSPFDSWKIWDDTTRSWEIGNSSDQREEIKFLQNNFRTLESLDSADCMQAYSRPLVTDRGDLVLVTNATKFTSSVLFEFPASSLSSDDLSLTFNCDGADASEKNCFTNKLLSDIVYHTAWTGATPDPLTDVPWEIEYCLSQSEDERCKVQFSIDIMVVVVVCNLVKVICMVLTLLDGSSTLVTIGDAIDNFLSEEDATTRGMCLATTDDLYKRRCNGVVFESVWKHGPVPQWFRAGTRRWFRSAHISRWVLCNALWCVSISVGAYCLNKAIYAQNKYGLPCDLGSLWDQGFGALTGLSLTGNKVSGLVRNAILANVPQLLVSVLFFTTNALLTCQLVEAEWNRLGWQEWPEKVQVLRVSRPRGAQRSTYYLGLPYQYSIPLMATFTLLHWLLSQSIFLADVAFYRYDGTRSGNFASMREETWEEAAQEGDTISSCGYSIIAIAFTLAVAGIVVILICLNGLRRFRPGLPLARGCSAIISAACHPAVGEPDIAAKPLGWGVVEEEEEIGHCSFSSGDLIKPDEGRLYAGYRRKVKSGIEGKKGKEWNS